MKLEQLKNRINELYNKYGDIEVSFDFKTGEPFYYSYQDERGNYINIDENFDSLFIEEILDVQEIYSDIELKNVVGICLSNYIQSERGDSNE